MSARDELLALDGSDEWPAKVDAILARRDAEAVTEAADALVTNFDWTPADRPTVEAVRNALRLMARGALPASPAAPVPDSTGGESAEDAAVRRSVDAQFPIVAAFLAEGDAASGERSEQPHCTAEYGGPGYTHCELTVGHDGQHESALGNMRRATWGGDR